jgi:hypothetical protein
MSSYGSLSESVRRFLESASGLSAMLRVHGCPMMDDTFWQQTDSGETFVSPDGITVSAFWLPCTLESEPPMLPGTCADCVLHRLVKTVEEQ